MFARAAHFGTSVAQQRRLAIQPPRTNTAISDQGRQHTARALRTAERVSFDASVAHRAAQQDKNVPYQPPRDVGRQIHVARQDVPAFTRAHQRPAADSARPNQSHAIEATSWEFRADVVNRLAMQMVLAFRQLENRFHHAISLEHFQWRNEIVTGAIFTGVIVACVCLFQSIALMLGASSLMSALVGIGSVGLSLFLGVYVVQAALKLGPHLAGMSGALAVGLCSLGLGASGFGLLINSVLAGLLSAAASYAVQDNEGREGPVSSVLFILYVVMMTCVKS